MLDLMDKKLAAYLRMTTSVAFYMPSNAPDVRALMREAMDIRQSLGEPGIVIEVNQSVLRRFDRIGIELLAWAETMTMLDKAKIPLN
jgi:predicted nuclease with RNAse H fold